MKRLLWIGLLFGIAMNCFGTNFTGVYTYNKGLNKASGTIYITQFATDSAFFMLQTMSGDPEFFTTEIKGFIRIENDKGAYKTKDSCNIDFAFTPVSCNLTESGCRYDFSTNGKYKKTNLQLKKGYLLMPAFSDKKGMVKNDSTMCCSIPHISSALSIMLSKNQEVNITDEFNGFYLIEVKNKKNEFLWVSKKNIQLLKNK